MGIKTLVMKSFLKHTKLCALPPKAVLIVAFVQNLVLFVFKKI